MKIAVTTPSGHIGSKVADLLIRKGVKVILLARDPKKIQDFAARGHRRLRGERPASPLRAFDLAVILRAQE